MMQFPPTALDELPAPIEPHEKKKRRLQVGDQVEEPVVKLLNLKEDFFHGCCEAPRDWGLRIPWARYSWGRTNRGSPRRGTSAPPWQAGLQGQSNSAGKPTRLHG